MIDNITSERWKNSYKNLHQKSIASMLGEQVMFHVWDIQDLCLKYEPKKILDYGCGKAYAYRRRKVHRLFNADMFFYDIGIEKFQNPPSEKEAEEIEAVVSCDVLEHIPEDQIDATFEFWYGLNPKFVFATVAQYPAIAKLPDGTNAHVTIKPAEWWEEKISKHMNCETHIIYCLPGTGQYKAIYKKL